MWGEGSRVNMTREDIASECLCIEKWNPPSPMAEPFVHNVVSTSKVYSARMPIDLEVLSLLLKNSTYDKRKFAAITIRTNNPFCTALLFTSGKLVITGVQSFYESVYAALCIVRMLNSVFHQPRFSVLNCVIQNMVAHSSLELSSQQMFDIQVISPPHLTLYDVISSF